MHFWFGAYYQDYTNELACPLDSGLLQRSLAILMVGNQSLRVIPLQPEMVFIKPTWA